MRHSSQCQHHLTISLNVTSLKVTISSSSRSLCWVNKTARSVFKVTCMCRIRKMLAWCTYNIYYCCNCQPNIDLFGWTSNFYRTIVDCTILLRNNILLTLYSVFQRWHDRWTDILEWSFSYHFPHRNPFKYILAPQANNVSYNIESQSTSGSLNI